MSKKLEFLESLHDREYRKVFNEEQVNTALAFQIRQLRESQDLTQEALAEMTGKAQETISQWENPNYGRYTLKTLKELAGALDVALLVRFVSFGELFDWTKNILQKRMTPPRYEEEVKQLSFASVEPADATWVAFEQLDRLLAQVPHGDISDANIVWGNSNDEVALFSRLDAGQHPGTDTFLSGAEPIRATADKSLKEREYALAG